MKKLWSIIIGLIIVAGLIFLLFRLDDVLFLANEITQSQEESNEITEEIPEEEPEEKLEEKQEELEETNEEENNEELNEDHITEESNN